ncbi:MAG: NADH-quinone oxidoreductase subunit K, partial [Alphaproteobacteria bacterium]
MVEAALTLVAAVLYAGSVYLLLSNSVIRLLLGVALLSNAVNLTIFTAGRVTREIPPIIQANLDTPSAGIANPLPQALILTAIVIGFSLFAFVLVLTYRSYQ